MLHAYVMSEAFTKGKVALDRLFRCKRRSCMILGGMIMSLHRKAQRFSIGLYS